MRLTPCGRDERSVDGDEVNKGPYLLQLHKLHPKLCCRFGWHYRVVTNRLREERSKHTISMTQTNNVDHQAGVE